MKVYMTSGEHIYINDKEGIERALSCWLSLLETYCNRLSLSRSIATVLPLKFEDVCEFRDMSWSGLLLRFREISMKIWVHAWLMTTLGW